MLIFYKQLKWLYFSFSSVQCPILSALLLIRHRTLQPVIPLFRLHPLLHTVRPVHSLRIHLRRQRHQPDPDPAENETTENDRGEWGRSEEEKQISRGSNGTVLIQILTDLYIFNICDLFFVTVTFYYCCL